MPPTPQHVLIGGYTAEMDGQATGITTWVQRPDGSSGEVSSLALNSPSYLVLHPTQPWVFAVTEGSPSLLTGARVQPDGSLSQLSQVATGGDFGAHLAVALDGRHVVVAHYGSGSVASFAIGPDGAVSERRALHPFSGHGTDPERQEGPHAHQVVFHAGELLVADLGTDRLHRLQLAADGTFTEAGPPVELPRGAGPRHLVVLGGDHLVVACELSAELWLGVRTETGWTQAARVPTSIAELEERIAPSAIRADGDTVFVANRGAGTVAVFSLNRTAHSLTRVQEFSCGGSGPRDLVLHADQLWVANQTNDLVSVFDRNTVGGPGLAYEFSSPSPTCLMPMDLVPLALDRDLPPVPAR